jgi:phosphatidylserine/phosphatidylglycerophosphate/cardiolipin synthase-like enzyme
MSPVVTLAARPPTCWAKSGKISGKVAFKEVDGNYVQWLIDGKKAFYDMCDAFCQATDFIYLIDSYFKPDERLVRGKADIDRLKKKSPLHQQVLAAVEKKNEEMMINDSDVYLISLLTVKAEMGVKVRIIIFHPDSVQDKIAGPFGWLESWGTVRHWSPWKRDSDHCIDLQLAMVGMTKEGHELGGHHQKSAVVCIDGVDNNQNKRKWLIGFCGGVDAAVNRWTDTSHTADDPNIDNPITNETSMEGVLGWWNGKKYLSMPNIVARALGWKEKSIPLWHDVHAKVVGPCAWDLAWNFADRYSNAETNLSTHFRREGAADDFKKTELFQKIPDSEKERVYNNLLSDLCFDTDNKCRTKIWEEIDACKDQSNVSPNLLFYDDGYSTGKVYAQIVRTYMRGRQKNSDYGIWDAYKNLFGSAKKNVYIESQYAFESEAILKALINNTKEETGKKKKLKILVVAPLMPDNYDGDVNDNLRRLIQATSPTQDFEMHAGYKKSRTGVYALQGRPSPNSKYNIGHYRVPIYVHAKVAVVDDEWAIVGSANLDQMGVSHSSAWGERGSSEIAIMVHGKDQALALRRMLVEEHLGPRKKPSQINDFDAVFEAFADAAKENGQPNSSLTIKDIQVVFHRVYDHKIFQKK